MKPKRIVFVGVMLAAAIAVGAQKQQDVERQFKLARNTELVDGNPKLAIEQYKKVADSDIRPLAAEALLRMAELYRLFGDATARATLTLVTTKYGDQKGAAESSSSPERNGWWSLAR